MQKRFGTLNFMAICGYRSMTSLPSDRKKYFRRTQFKLYLRLLSYSPYFRLPLAWLPFEVFTHEFRLRSVVCAIECVYTIAWVCITGAGGILISIQRRTILLARPLKDENEGFPGFFPFPARSWRRQCWASVTIFRMFAKALGKLCKRAIPTTCRKTGIWKGWQSYAREWSKCDAAPDRRQYL